MNLTKQQQQDRLLSKQIGELQEQMVAIAMRYDRAMESGAPYKVALVETIEAQRDQLEEELMRLQVARLYNHFFPAP